MILPTLPNELIEIILYTADLPIDTRLAFKVKPKKLIIDNNFIPKKNIIHLENSYALQINMSEINNNLCMKIDKMKVVKPTELDWWFSLEADELIPCESITACIHTGKLEKFDMFNNDWL